MRKNVESDQLNHSKCWNVKGNMKFWEYDRRDHLQQSHSWNFQKNFRFSDFAQTQLFGNLPCQITTPHQTWFGTICLPIFKSSIWDQNNLYLRWFFWKFFFEKSPKIFKNIFKNLLCLLFNFHCFAYLL